MLPAAKGWALSEASIRGHKHAGWRALAIGAALAAAGCSSSTSAVGQSSSNGDSGRISSPAAVGTGTGGATLESLSPEVRKDVDDFRSPLTEVVQGGVTPAEQRAKELQVQDAAARCMAAEGWVYTPTDPAATQIGTGSSDDASLSPSEYGLKYGYGFVRRQELDPDFVLRLSRGTLDEGGPTTTVDPNVAYVQSLPDSERAQYHESLLGTNGGDDGCMRAAQREVLGDQPVYDEGFASRLRELIAHRPDDPDIRGAEREWATCVSDALPSWTRDSYPNDAEEHFESELISMAGLQRIVTKFDPVTREPLDPSIDKSKIVFSQSGSGPDDPPSVLVGDVRPITDDDLDRMQHDEIQLWIADQTCQSEVGFRDASNAYDRKMLDLLQSEFPQFNLSVAAG